MSHQHHHNQQLYWRSHQKWCQTESGTTVVQCRRQHKGNWIVQMAHVPARVWIWRTVITIVYQNNMQYIMMLCCTCYMTAMLLVWRRRRRRIGASAANQPMHGFRGSREGSPGWYPAGLIFDPPQRLGLGNICLARGDWPLTYQVWYAVLLTCSTNAAFVGGRYSKVWDDWANICWRAWLTSVTVQETEYNEMTKLLMTAISSEEGVTGLSIRWQSVVVSSGRVLHFA